ncbi:MAG: NUDIX domain-containing protein [Alphaproteobacteria bacterium]
MSDIGSFMFGVGALIVRPDGRVLVLKRASNVSDWNVEKWELVYGRKAQLEEIEDCVRREILEETGIVDVEIIRALRSWHFFRGDKVAESEILGMTFLCRTTTLEPKLSREHTDYRWATPEEALNLIEVKGIRLDVECYRDARMALVLSGTHETLWLDGTKR